MAGPLQLYNGKNIPPTDLQRRGSHVVIRGRHYGPCCLCVDDDNRGVTLSESGGSERRFGAEAPEQGPGAEPW